ncbi:DUF1566 domain-containing protein [Paraburkholderia sp. HP33-1]|uniref:DUF1566 domain-containing protein n=1 Tax=Paraburkholderia sp. HP33-1 TaxID=2883243 RepID=UPI001F244811|nr:DUF1566 domain-containing protein [Paraburkholderia sp. HP33-1]
MKTMPQLQIPPLAEGEVYVGATGNKDGYLYHVILLPGDREPASWTAQLDWAKSIGGDLPNCEEMPMLFANFRDRFKEEHYWSNQEDPHFIEWARSYFFRYGTESRLPINGEFRARAVRRLPI